MPDRPAEARLRIVREPIPHRRSRPGPETALQTALQTAYFAEGVATFAIVMGVALLLSGIGFLILTLRVLPHAAGERKAAAGAAAATA